MASRTLPVSELRHLLVAVSDHEKQHLLEVEADLMQVSFLLSEAIEKLGNSFMAVHQGLSAQQAEVNKLIAGQNAQDDHQAIVARINALQEQVAVEVNAVVTGLQFQDMTSQLIARTIKRINGLRELLSALAAHGQVMEPEHEHEQIARLLKEMSHMLTIKSDELKGGLRKSVSQKDMDCGEIELF